MLGIDYSTVIDPFLRGVRRFIPEFGGIKPGERVLDVCSGSGAQVGEYRRRGILGFGLDLSPDMLRLSRRLYDPDQAGYFTGADARHLPFADASFDYTSITLALHDKPAQTRLEILAEMKRVVKPQSYILIADYSYPLPASFPGQIIRFIERIAGGEHYRNFRHFLKNGGVPALLEELGIKAESTQSISYGLITVTKAKVS
ncbi:MAG: SAM-dependent methlyltransferase [Dehalococcoides mccartyi]|uniref:class I SAM-dependent methyltransferase n=1 Tax=Dehalococcoides mccartyi TaxID=61435 RepID=UPI0024316864|nr:methyltransferase domain-containing protein [Dehalococcoides mccartyi]MCF7635126.1 SAM-dependent methlyltransferase [Dehalococcoides mccartyi]MEA2121959.1 2-methoxy-6-polyprenyl-1,4-benzoquinol methylase, mitochondrial [Dehalococcoides mccartyi]